VTINGRQAILRASGTLLNEDSLHVVTATDPAKDTLIKANYYVDNTLVYTSKDLGPFDLRYVGSGQHTLATVANYTSNQQVLFQEQVNQAYLNGLTHDFFVIYFQHRVLLLFAGGIAILFLLTELWLILSGSLRLRLIKKGSHSASRTQVANQNTSVIGSVRQATAEFWYSNLGNMLKRLMIAIGVLFIALAMVVVLNTWVVQIYQVDGPSMQSTLFTGNGLVVNKLEKTWAQLSGHQYTPTRNQVVVFVKQQNVLSGPVGTEPPTYVVKRVIGLPGERVVVTDATITVYNSSHPLGFNPETGQKWAKSVHHGSLERIDITLRPDELFLVGDNRPESVDSRSYGAVKVSELVGQAVYRITPLNQQKRL
jgi:signal peptidase I